MGDIDWPKAYSTFSTISNGALYLVTVDKLYCQYSAVLIYLEFYRQCELRSLSPNFDCLATAFVNILRVASINTICLLCIFCAVGVNFARSNSHICHNFPDPVHS